jgi:hypothetical protein
MTMHTGHRSLVPIRRGPRHEPRSVARPLTTAARRRAVLARRLASDLGQGTVEYVGLLLLMATILAAIVGAAGGLGGNDQIGKKVVNQIGSSIDKAGGQK